MDLQTRIEIVQCYYKPQRSPTAALRLFKKKRKLIKNTFSRASILKLIQKFEETGSVEDKKCSGRRSIDEATVKKVSEVVSSLSSSSPLNSTSLRKVAGRVDIPKSSVHNVMRKRLGLYPYKLQLMQSLRQDDKRQRVQFAQWLLEHPEIIPNILWSDEAIFSLDGTVNTHNCRIWGKLKPKHFITKSLHSPKLCIWMTFSSKFGLEPFFFNGTIDADCY